VLDSVFVSLLGEDVVLIVVFVSVLLDVAGDGFTTVVLLSFFSAGGLVTVVSFCSKPTAMLAQREDKYVSSYAESEFPNGFSRG